MKPSLHLKLSQQLAMTPQLQQAIRLLQLSTLDLRQEIQDALESNPLLEIDESDEFEKEAEHTSDIKKNEDDEDNAADASSEVEPSDSLELMEQSKLENELEIDASWEDIYSANTGHTGIASDDDMPVYQGETTTDLHSHLSWQLELAPFSELDRSIGTAIIDGIDEYGYLTIPLSDISESVGNGKVKIEDIEVVLKRIQQFEPLGVASRNLQECLLLQLSTLPEDIPWLAEAKRVLTDHIDDLGNRDYKKITRATKLKEPQLREVLKLIQQLNPRPGNQLSSNTSAYVIPDVSVVKEKGVWSIYINSDSVPRLRVHPYYSSFSKGNSPDNQFIRSNLQEAKWLIKSIESRNETLLKVARCIVEQQQDFFEYGEEAMKPMILSDIALAVEMHESTISRVTTQKFMHTPRGIFELKYFFSSHVNTDSGGECSSTVIRALIKKLIAGETPSKPLSDSKITSLLAEQGIKVARRTIAKYRESLSIAPSNQRKRLL